MLPLAFGVAEPARSPVSPISLPYATIIRRVATRFFSIMLGGSRAGEYQAGRASATALRGAIAR